MFSHPKSGPFDMMVEEDLEQVVDIEDNHSRERHLDPTFTSDFLRMKYIQKGKTGAASPQNG
jgi:hypothetical protein